MNAALLLAARSNRLNIVKLLLDHGADINTRPQDGETALHEAANSGYLYIVKLLLDRGADINTRDRSGRTALYLASKSGERDVTELLLKKGADASITTATGLAARSVTRDDHIRKLLDKPPAVDWGNLKKEISKKLQAAPPKPTGKLKDFCIDNRARVVYFSGANQRLEMAMYDLIYDKTLTEDADMKSANRWIHLPLNNVSKIPLKKISRCITLSQS